MSEEGKDLEETGRIDMDFKPGPLKAQLVCVNPSALPDPKWATIPLESADVTIGREPSNQVVLKVSGVSRTHARLYNGGETWGIEDLGSSNGLFVNKSQVEKTWLGPGDLVTIGRVHYKYNLAETPVSSIADADHQINLFDTEQTMVVRPGEVEALGEQIVTQTRSRAVGSRAQDQADSPGVPWLVVLLLVAAVVVLVGVVVN